MPTNKEKFNAKYKFPRDAPHSKRDISKITGIPYSILDSVYRRGEGARRSNPESVRSAKTGKSQEESPSKEKCPQPNGDKRGCIVS